MKITYLCEYKNIQDTIVTDGDISKYEVIQQFIKKHGLTSLRGFKQWNIVCEIIEKDGKPYIHTPSF